MKTVFFETMPGEKEMLLKGLPAGIDASFVEDKLTRANIALAKDAEIISVFVGSELKSDILAEMPRLKLIATRSMGFDHIDMDAAKERGIHINNVTTYASHPVAEFTFALLLAVVRKIFYAYNHLREGLDWSHRGLAGFNLFGKTMGIVGTGRIGRNVIAIAKGFGMNVVGFDLFPDTKFAREAGFEYKTLNELAAVSDIASIHVPYSKETHHLIGPDFFGHMKKGSVFINTARGEVVETHALVAALRDGTLFGAGLDVLEEERNLHEEAAVMQARKPGVDYELLTANHILIDLPNVVITPHVAYATREALEEIDRVTAETISNFMAGKEQKYL